VYKRQPDNRGYFHRTLLERAKPGVIFVNVARGELSPARDLLHLLDGGHLGGVGLDVYDNESELGVILRQGLPADDEAMRACIELSKRENAILTPHNAFNTREALERKAGQSVDQVTHFLAKKAFIWKV
jgi:D-lactate dehydrogenase